ncbi:MAG TPA: MarR family transcriptional regulator [Candidatus Choladousia intestinavium]|uniref:MarR family transcriptional regulator n=1 Tax=Candidatus Choladousia intestinavium TaxID=2840727 RepID=A0A9D1AAS8_9FIRM|nr:MarR family transcriptional regulator [Candidatus Choladousia intestinavium]
MNDSFSNLGRWISIFDRLMKMYYDRGLREYEIGWGQQFYVEYLYDHPGASPQEMAECIRVDKATLTKIMKKLTEIGYIRIVGDQQDRRVKHLYLTEKALPAARQIKRIHTDFYNTLKADIPPEELSLTEKTLQQMTENINQKVWHRMEDPHRK